MFFPFGHLFLSNHWTNLHQTWYVGGYYWYLYESWKSGWSVALCGFYIIKTAFRGGPSHLQSPISLQPLDRFASNLAHQWVLPLALYTPKIKIIDPIERILCIKRELSVCPSRFQLPHFQSPISQQPLGRFAPNLAYWLILSMALWILKLAMIGRIVRIL